MIFNDYRDCKMKFENTKEFANHVKNVFIVF